MKKMLVVFPGRCTGCGLCGFSCSLAKEGFFSTLYSRITLFSDKFKGKDILIYCHHCTSAPCMEQCPREAISRNKKTGAVIIDKWGCNHCGVCILACPFGAINYTPNFTINKCDLCGGDPECVKYCPNDALQFLEINDYIITQKKNVKGDKGEV